MGYDASPGSIYLEPSQTSTSVFDIWQTSGLKLSQTNIVQNLFGNTVQTLFYNNNNNNTNNNNNNNNKNKGK